MESILTSIKLAHGIAADCKDFDGPLIMHINSVFMTLTQLGVGPTKGFMIQNDMATWDQFLGYSTISSTNEDRVYAEAVKTYVYLKVKLVFDPPSNSSLLEAMKRQADEIEWRLTVQTTT